VIDTFRPLLDAARGLDVSDPAAAEATLQERFDPMGEKGKALSAKLLEMLEAGEIANRGELPMTYGRVSKACPESDNFTIDVVRMNGAGPKHRHPKGEINYAVRIAGEPTFDGRQPGWIVFSEGSEHVPTTAGGDMLIVYLLPEGAFEFVK
jgi:hypothetical protein